MNFCRFCGTPISAQDSTCPQCQRPLQVISDTPAPDLSFVPTTPLAAGKINPSPKQLQPSFDHDAALAEEQKQALARLQDMREQMELQRLIMEKRFGEVSAQLAQKVNKVEATPVDLPPLTPWQRRGLTLFLLLAGLAFVANLILIILYSKPNHRADSLGLGSTVLVIFGGFYLAYDLLGRQNGPLVRLTAFVTYALIGTVGASLASAVLIAQNINIVPLSARFLNIDNDPTAGLSPSNVAAIPIFTRGALFCLFWGALIGISGNLLTRGYKSSSFSWLKTAPLELLVCLVFWTLFFAMFIPIFLPPLTSNTEDKARLVLLVSLFLAFIPALVTFLFVRLYRFLIIHKLSRIKESHPRRYLAIFIPSTLFIYCLASLPMFLTIAFAPFTRSASLLGAIGVALGFALSGTLAVLLAPFTMRWVNGLDARSLGGAGLILASVGTILGIVPALLDLVLK